MKPVPANIWFDGDNICLECPADPGHSAHVVKLPIERCRIETNATGTPLPSQRGWDVLLRILKERYASSHRQDRVIATNSAPVGYMVEQWLKNNSPKQGTKKSCPDDISIEELFK